MIAAAKPEWSVLLMYSGGGSWYGFVNADNRDEAVTNAKQLCIKNNKSLRRSMHPSDLEVELVLRGRHPAE